MIDKKESLEAWKDMMCKKMYIEPDISLPETNWIQVGDCSTPDGAMKTCDKCRYCI